MMQARPGESETPSSRTQRYSVIGAGGFWSVLQLNQIG